MPIFSLPSPYGIGTLGKCAYDFIDFLKESGQSYWQILPLGPTSYGDSPYQSLSSFAGNPYFIDPDILISDGLVEKEKVDSLFWGDDPTSVDYAAIYNSRFKILYEAYKNGKERYKDEIKDFREKNSSWVEDYALFMALKRHFGMVGLTDWSDKKALKRDKKTLEKYSILLRDDIDFFVFIEFLFFKEWNQLRSYAKEKGIGIIGDIPIYVSPDSQDVWASPEFFQLDENSIPKKVSGVPPDYFNEDGQLWGNPLYDWDKMKEDNYSWWKRRIEANEKLYDVLRFDHFRGLDSYYTVKYGAENARVGEWVKGPGRDFTDTLNRSFPNIKFTAEDLGYLTESVKELLSSSSWPGMKVLEFAYDEKEAGQGDTSTYPENSICFTGTHDNNTLQGWINDRDNDDAVKEAMKRLQVTDKKDLAGAIILDGMKSRSYMMVVPLQDWLGKGEEARINTPGSKSGNWKWRLESMTELTEDLTSRIYKITKESGRI